ncbi:TPA: hypothetical protein L5C15_005760 [Pseudomonas aeruginosa]|uniref:hypothetical protein n=1 Tax=Pseudomonas aeruginosa TaxID=287 RepID=UPI0009417F4B|nr:hypothetical protein [Pseudomonas aeruginosa]OKS40416.1 hypothetical protein BH608_01675 [Pseudomonas aeruginosa]HBO7934623.1 hypothetical protein [Pseudomonas aeruginosa]HBO8188565.1 hypothetical protein [Pseudomonas aeruginosa]HBO8713814.1 hypothetical protein [Pseudomonas aeruginosa]HCF2449062.1 hypothetical protein [Pseudomonas aeruginosa]
MNSMRKLIALVLLVGAALVGCGEPEKQGITIGRGAIHLAQPAPELLPWLNANFRPNVNELVVSVWRGKPQVGDEDKGGTPIFDISVDGVDKVAPYHSAPGLGYTLPYEVSGQGKGFKFIWKDGAWRSAVVADEIGYAREFSQALYGPMLGHLEKLGYIKKI